MLINQQIKSHSTRWHYPLITYLTLDHKYDNLHIGNGSNKLCWLHLSCSLFESPFIHERTYWKGKSLFKIKNRSLIKVSTYPKVRIVPTLSLMHAIDTKNLNSRKSCWNVFHVQGCLQNFWTSLQNQMIIKVNSIYIIEIEIWKKKVNLQFQRRPQSFENPSWSYFLSNVKKNCGRFFKS